MGGYTGGDPMNVLAKKTEALIKQEISPWPADGIKNVLHAFRRKTRTGDAPTGIRTQV